MHADMATSSDLHEAARAWAEAGFAVFPCVEGAKRPATENGLDDATTDLDQIDRWWTGNPAYNIGVAPARSAMFVLDVDPPLGRETLAGLLQDHGPLPETLTIRTPRGGLHYWFSGECRSSVGKLGPKLDTRGAGGYVLVPPSVVDGNPYTYESDLNVIAEGPAWIAETLLASMASHGASDVTLDLPANVARASVLLGDYVSRGKVAIEGQGGDNATYAVAAEILNLGLSPQRAYDLLIEVWNPHCQPPWEPDDLAIKVRNAAEYAQNEPGAWALGVPAAEAFAHLAAHAEDRMPGENAEKRMRFYPQDEDEQNNRPDPVWIWSGLLPEESIAMLYGPSGSGKSFLALDIALNIAAGRAAYGSKAPVPSDVVYVAAEGASGIVKLRRPAWRMARQIDGTLPFYAIDSIPMLARPQEVIELIEAVKARGLHPKLLVLDTVARAMAGLNENDAKDAGLFIEACETIKRALGCTVLAIHHTGKDKERGGRGSSAFYAGFDTVLELEAHEGSKAVSLYARKHKDADTPEAPWTFEGRSVGPSLVYFETDPATHKLLTRSDDAFAPKKIAAALRDLGAIGPERAVTTMVLATQICPPLVEEDADARQRAVAIYVRRLTALARYKLEVFVTGVGRGMRWSIPAADPAQSD